jgi:3-methyl-2-oxobutanoate hydroxymethyltransferase
MGRTSTQTIRKLKGRTKVVCTTAYDAAFASLADSAGVDLILVGDSLGTTFLGFSSTIPVTVDMMLHHTAAVCRAKPNAIVVADMPFGVASRPIAELLAICTRFLQECGADAVKLEGGAEIADKIRPLRRWHPCVVHRPVAQRVFQLGGYRKFGKTEGEVRQLVEDAKAVEAAGAFCVVMEMVTPECAARVTEAVGIPTIGIGAGPHCDGQVLVCTDMLGLTPGGVPSFVSNTTT